MKQKGFPPLEVSRHGRLPTRQRAGLLTGFPPLEVSRHGRLPTRQRAGLLTGFTLIEVFISLFILAMAATGIFSLLQYNFSLLPYSQNKLIASYLGQEGIEIVRNLRDKNKIIGAANWKLGLEGCPAPVGCEADYTSQALTAWVSPGRFLNIDNGFYKYSVAGTVTPFKRRIIITSPLGDSNVLEVDVEVFWFEKGRSYSVFVRENLYNW